MALHGCSCWLMPPGKSHAEIHDPWACRCHLLLATSLLSLSAHYSSTTTTTTTPPPPPAAVAAAVMSSPAAASAAARATPRTPAAGCCTNGVRAGQSRSAEHPTSSSQAGQSRCQLFCPIHSPAAPEASREATEVRERVPAALRSSAMPEGVSHTPLCGFPRDKPVSNSCVATWPPPQHMSRQLLTSQA